MMEAFVVVISWLRVCLFNSNIFVFIHNKLYIGRLHIITYIGT